ncbi:sensor histidine kinase [Streptomyces sp. URMC 123]|uniref:sensor histidine kinase n=1 Tax=Streptomyces sp. URMC 123 TaxID=3423403 RepID=UPI003F1CC955
MSTRWREQGLAEMTTRSSRYVAWLRLPMLGPLALAGRDPAGDLFPASYFWLLAGYGLWSLGRLVWVYRRRVRGVTGAVAAVIVDLLLFTGLAALSGGQDSTVRYAYFVWPVATVLWQMPRLTAAIGAVCVGAYAVMSVPRLIDGRGEEAWPIVVDAAYLLWIIGACTLIAELLRRHSQRVSALLDNRELLLEDALAAETRQRAELADGLHDGAVQTLLAALHDLEEAEAGAPSPALTRAETGVRRTVKEMREAIFELHPQVLAAAGLAAALEAAGERFARRGGFTVHYDLWRGGPVGHEALLYSVARELLSNVVKHARATRVWVRLAREGEETVLSVRDNGVGFDPEAVRGRLVHGHIGLASHYVRIESAGGRFTVDSAPGGPTTVEVRLPDPHESAA